MWCGDLLGDLPQRRGLHHYGIVDHAEDDLLVVGRRPLLVCVDRGGGHLEHREIMRYWSAIAAGSRLTVSSAWGLHRTSSSSWNLDRALSVWETHMDVWSE